MNILARLEGQSKPFLIFLGFTLIAALGIIDFLTGYELAFSLFYVLPIAMLTWFLDRRYGLAASLTSALVWYGADVASRQFYPHPFIPMWNTIIRFAFFAIITFQLSALKREMQRVADLARIDYLTGAVNSRNFYALAQMEIDRFQRYHHPFTLAYFDLDNFKAVNDQFGHDTGDKVLCVITRFVKHNIRRTDVFARLGGDEFALLLPESDSESACSALTKLQNGLLEEMRQNDWAVTFSFGVLTCAAAPASVDELVKMADQLMYSVKRSGKNALKYETYKG